MSGYDYISMVFYIAVGFIILASEVHRAKNEILEALKPKGEPKP